MRSKSSRRFCIVLSGSWRALWQRRDARGHRQFQTILAELQHQRSRIDDGTAHGDKESRFTTFPRDHQDPRPVSLHLRARRLLGSFGRRGDSGSIIASHPAESKARIHPRNVPRRHMDPRLCEVERDAPTRPNHHPPICSVAPMDSFFFDIATALKGKADSNNPLAMEPPPELRKKLKLQSNEVCELVGNAYGRVDAPCCFTRN